MNNQLYIKAMKDPANQVLARNVDGAWHARNRAGEHVDALRSSGAGEADVTAAMVEYRRCQVAEETAESALEQAAH